MKFFHLSDLHIGLRLFNRDLREDQEFILKQIVDLAERERPDAVVVAGDIYDRAVPSAEAVEAFDRFIADLTGRLPETAVMLISGNHDSGQRLNCFRSVLARQNVYMIGMPPQTREEHIAKVTLEDRWGNVNFYLLPFVRPSMVRQLLEREEDEGALSYDETVRRLIGREVIDGRERNVLASHQFYLPKGKKAEEVERMDSEIRTVGDIDEVSADVLEPFDYAALGHIHKPMRVGGEFYRYCGTPLACSISEAGQQKSVLSVELREKGEISIRELPLVPMRQVRVIRGALEEIVSRGCDDYVTAVLKDREMPDGAEAQDRLRRAFPNLLEIRREIVRRADYGQERVPAPDLDPFELCCSFLKDADEEEKAILREVINAAKEENRG